MFGLGNYFPVGKAGCDSLWCRNMYVKWQDLTDVAQSLSEDTKRGISRLLIHCDPKQEIPVLLNNLKWQNCNYSHSS